MYHLYHKNMWFRQLFTVIYPCEQTHNIGTTWCKTQHGRQPVQPAARCDRIHLVQIEQVGCYPCHFDLKLTIYSSGLPTSFRYLLSQDVPLHFVIIISSLPQQRIMPPQRPQQDDGGTESSKTTGASSNTPPAETPLHHRHHLAHRDAANAATGNMTLDSQLKIVR